MTAVESYPQYIGITLCKTAVDKIDFFGYTQIFHCPFSQNPHRPQTLAGKGFSDCHTDPVSTAVFTGLKSYPQVYQQIVDNIIFYPVEPVKSGKGHYCHKYIKSYPQVQ